MRPELLPNSPIAELNSGMRELTPLASCRWVSVERHLRIGACKGAVSFIRVQQPGSVMVCAVTQEQQREPFLGKSCVVSSLFVENVRCLSCPQLHDHEHVRRALWPLCLDSVHEPLSVHRVPHPLHDPHHGGRAAVLPHYHSATLGAR